MTRDPARALADELALRGLATPARLLLDAHRPLAPLLSSGAVFLGPTIGALAGARGRRLIELLGRPSGIDELIDRIDEAEQEAPCPGS